MYNNGSVIVSDAKSVRTYSFYLLTFLLLYTFVLKCIWLLLVWDRLKQDGRLAARTLRMFPQLLRLSPDVFCAMLRGRQGGREDGQVMLYACLPHVRPNRQRHLPDQGPTQNPRAAWHRGQPRQRFLSALLLRLLRHHPGSPGGRGDCEKDDWSASWGGDPPRIERTSSPTQWSRGGEKTWVGLILTHHWHSY